MKPVFINRHEYPELDAILWDRADEHIDPEVAFHLYEERWRFLAQDRLLDKERALIADLAKTYGNGHMLVA